MFSFIHFTLESSSSRFYSYASASPRHCLKSQCIWKALVLLPHSQDGRLQVLTKSCESLCYCGTAEIDLMALSSRGEERRFRGDVSDSTHHRSPECSCVKVQKMQMRSHREERECFSFAFSLSRE